MMVLSQVRWGSNREDNNNSIKRDILRTPPHGHGHSRCMFYNYLLFFFIIFLQVTISFYYIIDVKYETKYLNLFLIAKLFIHV